MGMNAMYKLEEEKSDGERATADDLPWLKRGAGVRLDPL